MKYVFKSFSSLIFTENCCWNLTFIENMTLWPSLNWEQKWAGIIKHCYLSVHINLILQAWLSMDLLAQISISLKQGDIISYMIRIFLHFCLYISSETTFVDTNLPVMFQFKIKRGAPWLKIFSSCLNEETI